MTPATASATRDAPASITKLRVEVADEAQRQEVYRLRHDVYAAELGQHAVNGAGLLRDDLDAGNIYITVRRGREMLGFISVTPPWHGKYSLDKYLRRDQLPFAVDGGVFEVRLLTVVPRRRHSPVAALLMWGALRWVEQQGGRRIVAIGRREVVDLYVRVGLEPLGIEVKSGAVTFELMQATTASLKKHVEKFESRLKRVRGRVDWRLELPLEPTPPCYHGGAFFEAIGDGLLALERRHEVINADVLDAWFDPSPRVVEAMREHLPWLLKTSPPTGCEGMVRAIAAARGVREECVLPGAGSSDLIYLALRHWLTPESRVLILDPMYGEYAHVLERVIGCRVDRVTLRREEGYRVSVSAMADAMARRRYDLIVMVNPNSPTGRHVERGEMEQVLAAARGTRFWIDETYIEYAGEEQSLERIAAAGPNVVVCKSMSKVYALSGVRAAYLVGPEALVQELRPLSPPWAVSLPAQLAAIHALADADYYRRKWRLTATLRETLAEDLAALGLAVHPGVANFLLCHLSPHQPTAAELTKRCRARGLFIRPVSNMGTHLGDRAVRFAVKDEQTNRCMIEIIRSAL
jgi:histidinol-phosphate/aromatic aminotransferase/cobyric acid decarboxylase-like protein/N-acyl-L-homoserine lactone synthetase